MLNVAHLLVNIGSVAGGLAPILMCCCYDLILCVSPKLDLHRVVRVIYNPIIPRSGVYRSIENLNYGGTASDRLRDAFTRYKQNKLMQSCC